MNKEKTMKDQNDKLLATLIFVIVAIIAIWAYMAYNTVSIGPHVPSEYKAVQEQLDVNLYGVPNHYYRDEKAIEDSRK